ncbi:MAG: hypothetical protein JXR76_04205 [Deltaproteobacteria bacterium]|nr:hypothetical protein [Deltaproteobacteria bacterium]
MSKKVSFVFMNFIVVSALLFSVQAGAGEAVSAPVVVSTNTAYGGISYARYSSDSTQTIYCGVGTDGWLNCYARNSSGTSKSCYASPGDANYDQFVQVVMSINPASRIWFHWNSDGKCDAMSLLNGSKYLD